MKNWKSLFRLKNKSSFYSISPAPSGVNGYEDGRQISKLDWPKLWTKKITMEELGRLLSTISSNPVTKEELSMEMGDNLLQGFTSLEEFCKFGCNLEPDNPSGLQEIFEVFDHDRDGKISAEDLMNFFKNLGDESCNLHLCHRIISVVGRNGFVAFEDFLCMMDKGKGY